MPTSKRANIERNQNRNSLFTGATYIGFIGSIVLVAAIAAAVSLAYGAGWADGLRWFLYAIAAVGISAIMGLIFGIPRARTLFVADATERYESNSNLEQISDWLTKLLVGAGLVELNKVPAGLASLGNYLGSEMKVPNSSAYSITAILFGTGLGFIFGYVWVRLRLRVYLEKYDRLASEASRTGSLLASLRRQNKNSEEPEPDIDLSVAATNAVEVRESVGKGIIYPILWVDDNPHNNTFLISALRSLDIEVDLALSTAEAMSLFTNRRYGLVISDLGRMEEDKYYNETAGLDLIKAIRSRDKTISILIFAGRRALEMQDQLIKAGASLVTTQASILLEEAMRATTLPR